MYGIAGNQIDALDIIMRDQVAILDRLHARGEITTREHTRRLRIMVEAVS